jgi:hypothetical protein
VIPAACILLTNHAPHENEAQVREDTESIEGTVCLAFAASIDEPVQRPQSTKSIPAQLVFRFCISD